MRQVVVDVPDLFILTTVFAIGVLLGFPVVLLVVRLLGIPI